MKKWMLGISVILVTSQLSAAEPAATSSTDTTVAAAPASTSTDTTTTAAAGTKDSSATGSTPTKSASGGVPGPGSPANVILAAIAKYTNGMLIALTETSNPVVLALVTALNNLTSPDNASDPATPTPNMQSSFTTYVAQTAASKTAQTALQQKLTGDFFSRAGISAETVPYVNDLAFQAMLGTPFVNPDTRKEVDAGYNYLKFAAGLNIDHTIPDPTWSGSRSDQLRYIDYFNSATAIQTFNGYVLSQFYADMKNGISDTQTTLINQASDAANWFATITTESIGAVLRQTLMYQSQSYILLTQILQTEKMLLAAQAMNNTLIILNGQTSEALMVSKAVKKMGG